MRGYDFKKAAGKWEVFSQADADSISLLPNEVDFEDFGWQHPWGKTDPWVTKAELTVANATLDAKDSTLDAKDADAQAAHGCGMLLNA